MSGFSGSGVVASREFWPQHPFERPRSTKYAARRACGSVLPVSRTTHNYFEGTDKQAREHGVELQIGLAGQRFTFPPTKWGQSPLLHGDAVLKAYTTIRDYRIGR